MMVVALLALACVASAEDSAASEDLNTMSKEDLVKALSQARSELTQTKGHLKSVSGTLDRIYAKRTREENARKHQENKEKKAERAKEDAKKAAQLSKKMNLADVLMEHGAKFTAMKAAEKSQDDGNIKQNKAVLLAARKGARAGAVGPLKKIARAEAAKAVKAARAAAKKKGVHKKSEYRKITRTAAKKAVAALLQRQDKQVEKVAQKWLKQAVKKFPPSAQLADDTKPNHFTAPPTAHLSLMQLNDAVDSIVPEN
jgi:hypothetical protein